MVTNLEVDPFVRWKPISQALGDVSRKTVYNMIRRGEWPPPDRPARRRGEADLWRASTVRRALDRFAASGSEAA